MARNKIYLPGLNGIRAIAAMSVIFAHIGLGLEYYNIRNLNFNSLATHSVTMFFALSGFLITYLLLEEKSATSDIQIKKFYFRRVLRIWPLYYFYLLIIIIALKFKLDYNILYYIFMIPNYPFAYSEVMGGTITVVFLAHYWSVGVEEQFYAFWPWIVKYSKNILGSLLIAAGIFFVFKIACNLLNVKNIILQLIHYTRFGCLSLGGIFAFFYHQKFKIITLLQNRLLEILCWFLVLIVFTEFYSFPKIIDHEIFTLITLIIIINQLSDKEPLISLENKVFDYLGKISYGLYIYNPLVIYLFSLPFKKFINNSSITNVIIIYIATFGAVICVSHLSYFYFESNFLIIKNKFAVIKSKSSAS